MTTNTDVLDLVLYNDTTDKTKTFAEYRGDISGTSNSNFEKIDDFAEKTNLMYQMPGRLSLSATLAEPTTDLTGITSIWYTLTGRHGDMLPLWTGSAWVARKLTASLTLSLAGLTANTVYDVFVYDNAGTPTLEVLAWASSGAGTSTRATALATKDGRTVKAGDATRLFLGTILIDAAGGACSFSLQRRGVWNANNRSVYRVTTYNTTASWAYAISTVREINAGTGQLRGNFVIGLSTPIQDADFGYRTVGTSNIGSLSLSLNDTLGDDAKRITWRQLAANVPQILWRFSHNALARALPVGYNYITQTEAAAGGTIAMTGNDQRYAGFISLEM